MKTHQSSHVAVLFVVSVYVHRGYPSPARSWSGVRQSTSIREEDDGRYFTRLLTLGQTLVGQRHLTREQIEAETTEDAAERRDGDEAVGGTCLEERTTTCDSAF